MAVKLLEKAVGVGAPNRTPDVQKVAFLMNILAYGPMLPLDENGICDQKLVSRLKFVQSTLAGMQHPDGVVSPNGPTLKLICAEAAILFQAKTRAGKLPRLSAPLRDDHRSAVSAWLNAILEKRLLNDREAVELIAPGTGQNSEPSDTDYAEAAKSIGTDVETAMVKAFAKVESGPLGAFGSQGLPVIAYEGHIFRKYTDGEYDKNFPLLSYKYVKKAGPEWQTNNKDQTTAWKTLASAAKLNARAAAKACSWGRFQIMGFNHAACGYKDELEFVKAMKTDEASQLKAFIAFCKSLSGFSKAMKDKDYVKLASSYNGSDYGNYDKLIEKAYKALTAKK